MRIWEKVMSAGSWVIDRVIDKTQKCIDFVNDIGVATGELVKDLGAERVGELLIGVSNATCQTSQKTIKVIGGATQNITLFAIDKIGEVTGCDELCLIAWKYRSDVDILDECEKIFEINRDLLYKIDGKERFDNLKAAYQDGYEKIVGEYDEKVQKIFSQLETDIGVINAQREKSAELFADFEDISSRIADWNVAKYKFKEIPKFKLVVPPKTKNTDIFKGVDYDSNAFFEHLKGFFTLGNKGKLDEAAKKIEMTLQDIKGKCDAEFIRWQKISEAVDFVKTSFVDFNDLYARSLCELRYAINLVENIYFQRDIFAFPGSEKINPYFWPRKHLHCLMACDRLSRLLCEMSKRKYLDEKNEIIQPDVDTVKSDVQKFISDNEELKVAA